MTQESFSVRLALENFGVEKGASNQTKSPPRGDAMDKFFSRSEQYYYVDAVLQKRFRDI